MWIKNHKSWCVAHMAVLAGNFLGKWRSNPLHMDEWVGCGCYLTWLNAEFKDLSNARKFEFFCWKRLLKGPMLRLVFSRLKRKSGVSGPVGLIPTRVPTYPMAQL